MTSPERPCIEVVGCAAAYGHDTVLEECSFTVAHNERWAVLGANGTGKSTLIKMIAGILAPSRGRVLVNGADITGMPARRRAHTMAYVPQKPEGIIPYFVHDYLQLGRAARHGLLKTVTRQDRDAVAEAVDISDIGHLTGRLMHTLSGGELQRVLLAGAIAQETPLLLLDEPTSFLDPAHERFFFDALGRLHRSREVTLVMVTHDVNSALARCSHILALRDHGVLFRGTVAAFVSKCPELLNRLFATTFNIFSHTQGATAVFGTWEGMAM